MGGAPYSGEASAPAEQKAASPEQAPEETVVEPNKDDQYEDILMDIEDLVMGGDDAHETLIKIQKLVNEALKDEQPKPEEPTAT